MTRKDYIIVADIILKQLKELEHSGTFLSKSEQFDLLVEPMIKGLAEIQGSFDQQKFRNYILKRL